MVSLLFCPPLFLPSHLSRLSWPYARPPGSRLQGQLRSPPHYIQAVTVWTCHLSPAAWRHFCTGSFVCEKLWHTGLWAAAATSAARQEFYSYLTSSLDIKKSGGISSGRRNPTFFDCGGSKRTVNCACVETLCVILICPPLQNTHNNSSYLGGLVYFSVTICKTFLNVSPLKQYCNKFTFY